MKIKYSLLILLLIILNNCGFKPIYSSKENNFYINKISFDKKNKSNSIIKNNLLNYSNKKGTNQIDLNISTKKEIRVASRDTKGNPKIFTMTIEIDATINKNSSSLINKKFIETFNYENTSKKFELSQYEKNIEKNLINKIIENIILYLQNA